MAIEFKDYYATLGVSRTAGEVEIKTAFRKLARQYHPDVAKNKKQAEEKFKEINEAYEVLSDPDKRRRYDELGPDWKHGAEFRPPPGWQQAHRGRRFTSADGTSFEFGGTGFSDFFEQLFGSMRGRGRAQGFRGFESFGDVDEAEPANQKGRDVQAEIVVTLEEVAKGSVRSVTLRSKSICGTCSGSGQGQRGRCAACGGTGEVVRTDTHKVRIPPGVREGQSLRISGRGEQGSGHGPAGDLYLRVRYAAHPDFRAGADGLYCDVDLAPWEAVLGCTVSVPTLNGPLQVKVPPGTRSGQKLRLRGHGLPAHEGARGDVYAVLQVQTPEHVTESERVLWEKLARGSKFNPRE